MSKSLRELEDKCLIPEVVQGEKNAITFLKLLYEDPLPDGNSIIRHIGERTLANKVRICLTHLGLIVPNKVEKNITVYLLTLEGLKVVMRAIKEEKDDSIIELIYKSFPKDS